MNKRTFHLVHDEARRRAIDAIGMAPQGYSVTVAEPRRTLDQNARMWACLTDVAEQVEWYGKKLSPEDWKAVFTSGLRKLDVVPNLDGSGFVALGFSTSRMSRSELSDLMALIDAFGSERGVRWTEPEFTARSPLLAV